MLAEAGDTLHNRVFVVSSVIALLLQGTIKCGFGNNELKHVAQTLAARSDRARLDWLISSMMAILFSLFALLFWADLYMTCTVEPQAATLSLAYLLLAAQLSVSSNTNRAQWHHQKTTVLMLTIKREAFCCL